MNRSSSSSTRSQSNSPPTGTTPKAPATGAPATGTPLSDRAGAEPTPANDNLPSNREIHHTHIMPTDDPAGTPSNQPPVIFPVMNPDGHPEQPISVLVGAYDPDGDPLEYSITSGPPTASIDPTTGQFTWTPEWTDLGSRAVTVRVTDMHGAFAETTFIVTVKNSPPEMGVLMDRTGHPQQSVSFGVFAYDPDGDPLTYELVKGPPGATLDSATGHFDWTPTWNQLGAHIVTIKVKDPGGASDSDSCVITINNQAPIMDPLMDQDGFVEMPVIFQALAMDPDGDVLTYSLIKGPPGATVDPATGMFDWTPTSSSIGCHVVTIRCTDPGGAADQQSCVICITEMP